jgi:hypothetical protein
MHRSAASSLAVITSLAWLVLPADGYGANGASKGITTQLDVAQDVDGAPVLIDATVNVTQLTARNTRLLASATIVGTATVGTQTKALDLSVTVDASVAATCGSTASLTITLYEVQLVLSEIPITLRNVALTVTSPQNTLVGGLSCSIAQVLTQPKALQSLVTLVNTVLTSLLDGGVVSLVASVHLNQFTLEGGRLLADATVNGTLSAKDLTLPIAAAALIDATVAGQCDATRASLRITLNELQVGAAGLLALTVVDTSVTIDSGSDATLRTLICEVTPLLLQPLPEGGISEVISLLNQILALLP